MISILKRLVLLGIFIGLTGCSSSAMVMRDTQPQSIKKADKDSAQIIFMRSSFVAGAITAELFDVTDGNIKFIGALPNGNKIAYKTTPGKKVFMAYGTAADFMLADVVKGKTYYSIVTPNWGTGGFAPMPVRTDGSTKFNTASENFSGWLNGTTLIEMKPAEAKAWFTKNKINIETVYKDYWNRFQDKNLNQRAKRTMYPTDGIVQRK